MQQLDWKSAFREFVTGNRSHGEWYGSREREAMMAEANGKVAAEWSDTAFVGMAAGYARIAAHHARIAYPEIAI